MAYQSRHHLAPTVGTATLPKPLSRSYTVLRHFACSTLLIPVSNSRLTLTPRNCRHTAAGQDAYDVSAGSAALVHLPRHSSNSPLVAAECRLRPIAVATPHSLNTALSAPAAGLLALANM